MVNNADAQVTSSPYSIFGMGNIEENSIGGNKAMGGTGIALMSENSVNLLNPASYNGLDTLVSVFEMGFLGKYTSFKDYHSNQKLFDADFKYLTMGFKIAPKMATSFGITSYSTVGYNINVSTLIEGSPLTYNKIFSGEGGVNQVYLGGSYSLFKNLSLGINAVYLFGNITHSESSSVFNYSLKSIDYLSNFNLNYGLNYQVVTKKWKYNIGLIYDNGKTLATSNVSTISALNVTETLRSTSTSLKIPRSYGIGVAASKDYFKIGIDYEIRKWKGTDFSNPLVVSRNSDRVSLGIEFPSQGINKGTSRMILYRFGAEYKRSDLVIDNVPINYRSVSLGAGLPFKGALSIVNVALELGQNGSIKNGLFQENFCTLHIDLSLKDNWFIKRKYQ
jgi:hypothetical protein